MEFSSDLIRVLEKEYPLKEIPIERVKVKPIKKAGRFPICCALGYYLAKRKWNYPDKILRALGYGLSLAPNIARAGWKRGMRFYHGTPVALRGNATIENEDRMLDMGYKIGEDYDVISFFRWDFIVNFRDEAVTLARMRKLEWWTAEKYDSYLGRFTPAQKKRLFSEIEKELGAMKWEQIDYKYCKSYKTFWQPLMDRLREKI